MIEAYMKATEDVLRLAGQMFLRRMDDQLRWFAEDLHDFIYELDRNPRRDWRERFDTFLADQASRDRVITPESRRALIAYLEMWERNVYGGPPEPKPALQTVVTRVEEPTVVAPETASVSEVASVLPPRTLAGADKPAGWWPFGGETVDFYRKLNDARGCIYDIERMLPAIVSRIANAKEGEPLEIDDELNAIDTLIWRHNDLLESAREIWLRENFGSAEFAELDLGPTPVSLGLPLFTDDQQAARAKAQLQKIGTRLKQRIAFLDNVIFAMEVIETAGTIASFALGAGVIINAGIQGGKVVLIKTVAKMAASAVAGELIGQATNAALNAVGLEDEQIAQVQGAVEIISTVLQLRRMGKLKTKLKASSEHGRRTARANNAEGELAQPNTGEQPDPEGVLSRRDYLKRKFNRPDSVDDVVNTSVERQAKRYTDRIQSHVNDAAQFVDSSGGAAFTERQIRAILNADDPAAAYRRFRGYQIDRLVRQRVRVDPHLAHLQGKPNLGPDFIDPNTRRWWDMTTTDQWSGKIPKYQDEYGPQGTWVRAD